MRSGGKSLIFVIIFLLILMPIVSSISTVLVQTQDDAIFIEYPKIFVLKQNEDFHLRFHASNKTDGKLLTNETTNCTLNFYNSSGEGILRKENLEFGIAHTTNDCQNCFGVHILGGNFTNVGYYSYLIRCENSETGGAVSVGLEVTPTGYPLETPKAILYFLLTIIMFSGSIAIFYLILIIPYQNPKNEEGVVIEITKLKYLKVFLITILYPIVIVTLNLMNGLAVNFMSLTIFSGIIGFFFEILLRLAWIWTVIMALWIIYLLIRDTNFRKIIKQHNLKI